MADNYAVYISDTGANNRYNFKVIRKDTAITEDTTGTTTLLTATGKSINEIQAAVARIKNNLSDNND